MATVSVTVDDEALYPLHELVRSRGFASPEAFVESLVIAEVEAAAQRELEAELVRRLECKEVETLSADGLRWEGQDSSAKGSQ